ncbi:putative PTH11-type G-protein coupled receptor protein [Purpureocillium lavendulum]|uniref:PTH11-type G-protein coupled receptor protein n=1 Tax=Purpureocillium lavendulum TaxID=1247861 RepID=A0AB34FIN8_9HYPO|nr:putative PTH11-type G-protein coupled receptor protein [Purpureocillium lavendulum]
MKGCNVLLSAAFAALPVIAQAASLNDTLAQLPECASPCLPIVDKSQSLTALCMNQTVQDTMALCVLGSCSIKESMFAKNLTTTACGAPIRNRSSQYIAISDAFSIIASLFVIQRLAYKYWAKLDYGLDDLFTLITLIVSFPVTYFNAYPLVWNGVGRDSWTLTLDQVIGFVKYFYVMEIIYFAEVSLLKLALLFFYIRIFPTTMVRRLLWATIAVVSLFGVTFVFLATFQCTPVEYYWWQWAADGVHHGTCIDIMGIGWSNAAISIALDAWMLGIPLWQLRTLNLDLRKKVGVAMMFCVGTFVTIVSMLRLRSLVQAGASTVNPTWDFFEAGVWSTVEINVGIICICMPSLRLLLVRIFPGLRGMSTRYYGRSTSGQHRSGTARVTGLPPGTGTRSHAERSQHRPDVNENHITYQTTYTVEYGDKHTDKYNDTVQLVHMRDGDAKSARSGSGTSDF